MIFVIIFAIMYLPLIILYPTKIIGKKNMPKKGKLIVTSNHYTNLDALIYNAKFVTKFRFMAKAELFKNKFFGFILKSIGAYPVDREKVSPSVFKKTLELLNKNKRVFIFPEGTRNKTGSEKMIAIKTGVITFASKGGAQIVPMLLYQPPKIFRKNYIIVGEPLMVEGENPKRLTKEETQKNLERYEAALKNLRIELDEYVNLKNKKKR